MYIDYWVFEDADFKCGVYFKLKSTFHDNLTIRLPNCIAMTSLQNVTLSCHKFLLYGNTIRLVLKYATFPARRGNRTCKVILKIA